MPVVDRRIKLHPRITTDGRPVCDHVHEITSPISIHHAAISDGVGMPFAIVDYGSHKVVRHPNTVVGVLEEH